MKKFALTAVLALFISSGLYAGVGGSLDLTLNETSSVSYYVPDSALYAGDPYEEPDYLYTVAKTTYSNDLFSFSYNLAMGIHDVNDNDQTDTWYDGENRYIARAGANADGDANWNIDVYVNPVVLGIEKLTGAISYVGASESWTKEIEFFVDTDFDGDDTFVICKWLQFDDAAGSDNPEQLLYGTKSGYDVTDIGTYTISLNYGVLGYGVSNEIIVEVTDDVPFEAKVPTPTPVVPAPGAILLSSIGAMIAGKLRRNMM